MKQYTIIEHDGQKWLSPVAPHGADPIAYHMNFSDLLYLGIRSVGETVDEREVSLVSQVRPRNIDNIDWVTTCPGKSFTFGLKYVTDLEFRTAYVDATPPTKVAVDESHKSDYWKRRCLAAEKYIDNSPCDPDIYEEQMVAHRRWQSIVKKEPK